MTMPRVPEKPPGARTITTYAEFERYLRGFAKGDYKFLWVVGRPGLSKSRSIRRAVEGMEVCYLEAGQLTPIVFFEQCHLHLHKPIILDDAEDLMDHRVGYKLLCALGQTDEVKALSYHTSFAYLANKNVPATFRTRSTLCVLANRWTPHPALHSRAVLLYFDPTPLEVHKYVGTWFQDQEIYDWFGNHLHLIADLDCRLYGKAVQDKRAGNDWRKALLDTHCHERVSRVVQELEVDCECKTVADRVKKFKTLTNQSRATYYRLKAALEEKGQLLPLQPYDVPRIDLSGNLPFGHDSDAPVVESEVCPALDRDE
jgi:hypothetical protein